MAEVKHGSPKTVDGKRGEARHLIMVALTLALTCLEEFWYPVPL